MGGVKRSEITPEMLRLMSPEDQKRYAESIGISIHQDDLTAPPDKPQPRNQTDLERVQQREFANWIALEGYPLCWHRTDKKSTATIGCPDFVVGVCGVTLWIEFKRPGYPLAPDQEKFRQKMEKQKIAYHIVYSSAEAIKLVKAYDL